jgi:putative Holliday junction resolvase
MPESAPKGSSWVALAFDFGLRRIGIASGDSITRRAAAVSTIDRPGGRVDWTAIESLIRTWQPAILVVGVPYNSDGSPGTLTEPAREFARELRVHARLPVELMDERWSSIEAAARLKWARQTGQRVRRVKKADIDAAAACVILERWFQEAPHARTDS